MSIFAGKSDEVEKVRLAGRIFFVVRNSHIGYLGISEFKHDGEDEFYFTQCSEELKEFFGKKWETLKAKTILKYAFNQGIIK